MAKLHRSISLIWLSAILLVVSFVLSTTTAAGTYSPTLDGGFLANNASYFHNRPLYGDHNSLLVLAGDRPIIHFADDSTVFGGWFFGLLDTQTQTGSFSWNANNITSFYKAGTFSWTIQDTILFPGVSITATVVPVALGQKGMSVDMNVTTTEAASSSLALVWGFGCGIVPSSSSIEEPSEGEGEDGTTSPLLGNPMGWVYDPLVNPQTISWTFDPSSCLNNKITLLSNTSSSLVFGNSGERQVMTNLNISTSDSSIAMTTLTLANASNWNNITALVGSGSNSEANIPSSISSTLSPPLHLDDLPVAGAALWLRASSLQLTNNSLVSAWKDESGASATPFDVTQTNTTLQPIFVVDALGPGQSAVKFDGVQTMLMNVNASIGSESTFFAVFRDQGSSGGDDCCSGVVYYVTSCNGIATLPALTNADDDDNNSPPEQHAIVTKLDYAGSDANGRVNIRDRTVLAANLYTATGPSSFWVDGCLQGSAGIGGTASAGGVMIGTRNNELQRFFNGMIGEVIVFNRTLNVTEMSIISAYLTSAWPSMPPKDQCEREGQLIVGKTALPVPSSSSSSSPITTRFTWSFVANVATASDPLAQLQSGLDRIANLTRTAAVTPDPLINAAILSMGPAVDGLFRDDPGAFVHGAMAWDVVYVGWRSEYGGTVYGRTDLVANEGNYFFANQNQEEGTNTVCQSDPSRLMTIEASTSRFYGKGRITVDHGMYDMQSQMFDQQVHMWRWVGNTTHEPLLRSALALHAEWAEDCFDADKNGLYASYINTWPTDSVWYNGGETVEETAYIYRTQEALRDMAYRAGNATEAEQHQSIMDMIVSNMPSLWIQSEGHPAAFREEGGHKRLRPDAWLYAVSLPIEAKLFTAEEAAQALYYTEWGLERDPMPCGDSATLTNATRNTITVNSDGTVTSTPTCGEVVWTSNWIPSQWSVRQLWSGDNYALAFSYFLAGLPDDGYAVLQGTLQQDMILTNVPGQAGKSNGGTDFNDCVHPLSRTLIEGLFGYHPDYISNVVEIAPQFPSSWPSASMTAADFTMDFSSTSNSASLNATLKKPVGLVTIRLPIRALSVSTPTVTSAAGVNWNWTVEGGYGQSIVVISVAASSPSAQNISSVSISLSLGTAVAYMPSVHYLNLEAGTTVTLSSPLTTNLQLQLMNVSDPQLIFVPGSVSIVNGGTGITGTLNADTILDESNHMVIGYAVTTGGSGSDGSEVGANLPQIILFKLDNMTNTNSSSRSSRLREDASSSLLEFYYKPKPAILPYLDVIKSPSTTWSYIPVNQLYNADVNGIYTAGMYLSPRPETCGVRIGTDGWSAWTFTFWGGPSPPKPDFAFLSNCSIGNGIIETSQGAQFSLNVSTGQPNIAFASLWDNYPSSVNVTIPSSASASASAPLAKNINNNNNTSTPTAVWVLLAGSTNPMQTRLANAILRFTYENANTSTTSTEEIELTPPYNFWSLTGWGNNDYDFATDSFALSPTPPPQIQLGNHLRAMVYMHELSTTAGTLTSVELEVMSQEVVIGILAVSVMGM